MRLAAVALLLATPALADDAIEKCRAIKGAAARLACFDGTAPAAAPAPASGGKTAETAWIFDERRDEMTDEAMTTLLLPASEGKGALSIGCIRGQVIVMIHWQQFLSTRDVEVTHRVDALDAETVEWDISSDHTSTGYPMARGKKLVEQMAAGKQYIARVTPYGETSVTQTFRLAGLDAELPKMKGCF